jgi:hypothetical protein
MTPRTGLRAALLLLLGAHVAPVLAQWTIYGCQAGA